MTADLVSWLRTQLDEDERVARAASGDPIFDGTGIVSGLEYNPPRPSLVLRSTSAAHIAHWDPTRVLAEVEAKRRILDEHYPLLDVLTHQPFGCKSCRGGSGAKFGRADWPCPTACLLALPYADRPGYLEEWRP